jgi:2-keto-3-deoxy-galactonokinase
MIHAVQATTVLASAVPQGKPAELDEDWVREGMREQRRSSLARALFCVRLLELAGKGTAAQRMAFLVGAFISADVGALLTPRVGGFDDGRPVLMVGSGVLAGTWKVELSRVGVEATIVSEQQAEAALLAGLRKILDACVDHQLV